MPAAAVAPASPAYAWAPQPGPQTAACACPVPDLFYGGERGGGKTDFLLGDFAGHAGKYGEHARGILFRRHYKELDEIVIRSRLIYPKLGARFKSSKDEYRWEFPNGASLVLRHLERNADADQYEGHQYSWMGFDQIEKFPSPEPVDKLWGSVRSPYGVPCVRRSTGNPPAPWWVRERYIEGRTPGVPFTFRPQPELRPDLEVEAVWIRARLEDNVILQREDPGYESRLASAGSEALFRAWRYGDWDAFVGQVFKEWRRELHVLDEFTPPPGWRFAGALDWGYRDNGCFGLYACGPDDDVVKVEELYFHELHGKEAGYAVGVLCHPYGEVEYVACDHDLWKETGVSAPTIAEEFLLGMWAAYQDDRDRAPRLIEATKGRGSRAVKLILLHRYLAWKSTPAPTPCPAGLPVTGRHPDGTPKLVVQPWNRPRLRFHQRCSASVRTIPQLQYHEKKREDIADEQEDHPYDETTIFLMSRPPLVERAPRPEDPDIHPGVDPQRKKRKKRKYEEALEEKFEHYDFRGSGYKVPREYVQLED